MIRIPHKRDLKHLYHLDAESSAFEEVLLAFRQKGSFQVRLVPMSLWGLYGVQFEEW